MSIMDTLNGTAFQEQLDRLTRVIALLLEDQADGALLAGEACLSRFHFQRVFRRLFGETPGALRRRLLLERAAWQLRHTETSVTEVAFDNGYDSLEGFSRAFRRAYSVSPGHYRRLPDPRYRLSCSNGIHYDPRTRRCTRPLPKGAKPMDLTDRLMEHDAWMTRRLLERAAQLTDAQLDAALPNPQQPTFFESPDHTLRITLERLVFTKEVWVAAANGRSVPENEDRTIAGLQARMKTAFAEFSELVRSTRDEERWDETFVDELCCPAETFTYGGMIAHVITYSAFRRLTALKAMESLGIHDLGFGDPIEWERALAGV